MAVKRPKGQLPKGGGPGAKGTKLVNPSTPPPAPKGKKGTGIGPGSRFDVGRFRMGEEKDRVSVTPPVTPPTTPTQTPSQPPQPPDIDDTTSVSGNISEYGTGAPTYTEPKLTEEEIARQEETKKLAQERLDAFGILKSRYKQYGLESLAEVIKKLVIEGASEATITFALQESAEYKERFKANTARLAKGLRVLEPDEYLSVEDGYRQSLRAYGLTQFDNDAYVSKFIENDVSPTELNSRIQLAAERIVNAAPQVKNTLINYYGLNDVDLIAYTLDPAGQLPQIQKQITTAEIGAAAARQGFQTQFNKSNAEYLASLGVDQQQAVKGFSAIADVLPQAQKLTDIYKDGLEGYGMQEAQQEIFEELASARRKRQKLTARETAQFQGSTGTGLGQGGLSTQYLRKGSSGGQF